MPYYPFKQSGGSGSNTVKLIENLKIGISSSLAKSNPYDSNNYISVSNDVVTLKRNNSSYALWLSCPFELQTGKIYILAFESVTNTDGFLYLDKAINGIPTTGDVQLTRIMQVAPPNGAKNGMVFKVSANGYYGFPFWSNNTNDIIITNPTITEIN